MQFELILLLNRKDAEKAHQLVLLGFKTIMQFPIAKDGTVKSFIA